MKKQQKKHLIDIMQDDEKLGLYDEPKQETLEEAGERLYPNRESFLHRFQNIERKAFTEGVKWQQERSYSEEEVYNLVLEAIKDCYDEELEHHYSGDYRNLKEWFERFKKKNYDTKR